MVGFPYMVDNALMPGFQPITCTIKYIFVNLEKTTSYVLVFNYPWKETDHLVGFRCAFDKTQAGVHPSFPFNISFTHKK